MAVLFDQNLEFKKKEDIIINVIICRTLIQWNFAIHTHDEYHL